MALLGGLTVLSSSQTSSTYEGFTPSYLPLFLSDNRGEVPSRGKRVGWERRSGLDSLLSPSWQQSQKRTSPLVHFGRSFFVPWRPVSTADEAPTAAAPVFSGGSRVPAADGAPSSSPAPWFSHPVRGTSLLVFSATDSSQLGCFRLPRQLTPDCVASCSLPSQSALTMLEFILGGYKNPILGCTSDKLSRTHPWPPPFLPLPLSSQIITALPLLYYDTTFFSHISSSKWQEVPSFPPSRAPMAAGPCSRSSEISRAFPTPTGRHDLPRRPPAAVPAWHRMPGSVPELPRLQVTSASRLRPPLGGPRCQQPVQASPWRPRAPGQAAPELPARRPQEPMDIPECQQPPPMRETSALGLRPSGLDPDLSSQASWLRNPRLHDVHGDA